MKLATSTADLECEAHRRENWRQWRDRTWYSLRARLEAGYVHRDCSSRLTATTR